MQAALYYQMLEEKRVQCFLCPHRCILAAGKTGICRVRKNYNGELIAENYGKLSAIHLDPIEKKPLYHFMPGSQILSIGSVGCNLQCQFCQNCEISQSSVSDYPFLKTSIPDEIVQIGIQTIGNIGIAYTYNEPVIFYEFMLDTAILAKEKNLKNVVVSNGFISAQPMDRLLDYIDAFNIDLKANEDEFYKKYTHSSMMPVKETLKRIRKAGRHLEVTNLVIPNLNDKESVFLEMVRWIAGELGGETILHLSRYFPRHKMSIESTPGATLENLYNIACRHLNYVYLGNIPSGIGKDTLCPKCRTLLIERTGYLTQIKNLDASGECSKCGTQIAITLK